MATLYPHIWSAQRKDGRKEEKKEKKERMKKRKRDLYIYIYIYRERERERERVFPTLFCYTKTCEI